MSNDQMTENRFYRWAKARKLVSDIQRCLSTGGNVVLVTYTKATKYTSKHVAMFKATKSGAYVQHGKNWLCIDYCGFRFMWTSKAVAHASR